MTRQRIELLFDVNIKHGLRLEKFAQKIDGHRKFEGVGGVLKNLK